MNNEKKSVVKLLQSQQNKNEEFEALIKIYALVLNAIESKSDLDYKDCKNALDVLLIENKEDSEEILRKLELLLNDTE